MAKCTLRNRIWASVTFFMILMIMLFCSGCMEKKEQPTTEAVVKEKPLIKQKKVTIDSEKTLITDYTYNDFGDVTLEVTTYENGDPLFYYKNVYDEDGNILEKYRGTSADDLQIDNRYEYVDGKLMVETVYSFDGSIMDIYDYTYNDDGLLINKIKRSEDGYVYREYKYEYDDDGRLSHMTDLFYEYRTEYTYDEEGRTLSEEAYLENGELSYSRKMVYGEYGITDNYFYSSKTENHNVTRYDENGRKVSEASVDEDGNESVIWTWEYDDAGNMIHSIGSRGYEYTAEYNEYGDPVKVHDVCMDSLRNAGTYDTIEEYEYIYYE